MAQNKPDATTSIQAHGNQYEQKNFNLLVDGVPYLIKSTPFLYNDELRFRVSVNNDAEHIFTWDSEIRMIRAIDDEASTLPESLEEAISEKLQSQLK